MSASSQAPPAPAATVHTAAIRALGGPQGSSRALELERPGGLAWRCGQVALLGLPGGERAYFAIATAPREGTPLRFLIKADSGPVARGLLALSPGDPVTLEGPLGPGFDLAGAPESDVLLVAAGTGIAPLRSALVELLDGANRPASIALVHGVRHPADAAFADEHAGWSAAGVRARVVVSQPSPDAPWAGSTGHVQAHLGDLVSARTLAFVVGMKPMVAAVRETLRALGVSADRVRTNF